MTPFMRGLCCFTVQERHLITQRKFRAAVLASGAALTGVAAAGYDNNLTIYGIVDQSVRYTNHATDSGGNLLQLTNGAITNSRFGFKGEEDLGGGAKAVFRLESGFDPQNGMLNQGGRLFGRYAYVGLSDTQWGTLIAGRQGTESFNFFGDFDPLTVGNYMANSWPFLMTVGRIDNTVTYAGKFGGLNLGATYGFGNQFGSMSKGNYWGGRTSYDAGPLSIGVTYQEMRDLDNQVQRMWGAGAHYTVGLAKIFLGYLGGRDGIGFIDSQLNAANRTVAHGSYSDAPRKDSTLFTGVAYQATPRLTFTGAFYYSSANNINGFSDNRGKRYATVLLAEYSLSRRTQVYGTVDFNRVTGGAWTELPGKSNQTGAGVGLRHIF